MKERVIAWYDAASAASETETSLTGVAKLLPKSILFYRDGVSESQYGMVMCEEKYQILRGCQDALSELKNKAQSGISRNEIWEPRLTLLTVTKRHHSRFYPVEDTNRNNTPGMVVDTKVIERSHVCFYLQSHYSPLGTARSAYYHLLFDNNNWDLLHLKQVVCLP